MMLSDYLFLVSSGPMLVASVAYSMAIFQFWVFINKKRPAWMGWGTLALLAAAVYGTNIFFNFHADSQHSLLLTLRLMYSALMVLFYSLANFIYSFLNRGTRRGHVLFALSMLAWLILLWFTPYMLPDRLASRSSLWLGGYYPNPALKPLGILLLVYFFLIIVHLFCIWPWKQRSSLSKFPFLVVGMVLWALLGLHDILAAMFKPTRLFIGEYGVLGFCFSLAGFTVTNYLNLERSLVQAQKTEAISRLAGGIAHDFKNVLQVISMNAEYLLELSPVSAQVGNSAQRIIRSSQRGITLVRGLLSLGRQGYSRSEPLELNQEIRRLAEVLATVLPVNIKLDLRLCFQELPIWGTPEQLEQILLNLTLNARDAMPEGGTLTLATSKANLQRHATRPAPGLPPGPYCQLRVADIGVGMDSQTAERAFDPFFTTKGSAQGSGLGLSTIQTIMETNGGAITCQSAPGQGTVFSLYWPRRVPGLAPDPAAGQAKGGEQGQAASLLLVDDEISVLETFQELLSLEGYLVRTAQSGQEALSRFQEHPAQLVIMDLMMPGLRGQELLRRLLAIDRQVKVVVVSGDLVAAREQMPEDGNVVAHLGKPVPIDQLRQLLARVLGHQAPRP